MKKIVLAIVCLVLLLGIVNVAGAAVTGEASKLTVTLISQEPDPVNPGEIVDVRFKVENYGNKPAEDILFEFVEEFPFSVYTGDSQQQIGTLQGLQRAEEGIIVLYKVKVDEEAVQGTYLVDVKYKMKDGLWSTVKDFPLRVRTRDLVLSVDSIVTTPSSVSPGEDFELALTLKNNADSLIRDITVNLDLSSSDVPFAPSGSIAEKQIYQIQSSVGKVMRFDLLALPEADGGIYKVPINVTYTDETGASYTKNDFVSIRVSSAPDLLATVDSSEVVGDVKSGKVVVKIVNRGLTNVKLLTAKLLADDKYSVLSEPEVYVGNIDSDDYETVGFDLAVKSYDSEILLPLELSYRDSTNKLHNQKVDLVLRTQSDSLIVTVIKSVFNGILLVIVVIGIVLGVRWFLRRRKRKKRQG